MKKAESNRQVKLFGISEQLPQMVTCKDYLQVRAEGSRERATVSKMEIVQEKVRTVSALLNAGNFFGFIQLRTQCVRKGGGDE